MLRPEFVTLIRCVLDGSPLVEATPDLLGAARTALEQGALKTRHGETVTGTLDGLLVRADGKLGYPIVGGIPALLGDAAINLEGLPTRTAD
jgi:uncharacterized protein YbaR (Trm112 family)